MDTGGSEFSGVLAPIPKKSPRDPKQMTRGLRFQVKWVYNVLGFRVCGSKMFLKVFSSRKTSRKVRAVEVPFGGGSKRESSLGAPKWAIYVKTLLNDLFKLIKSTFHLNGSGLSDLKGDCGSIFCASSYSGYLIGVCRYRYRQNR